MCNSHKVTRVLKWFYFISKICIIKRRGIKNPLLVYYRTHSIIWINFTSFPLYIYRIIIFYNVYFSMVIVFELSYIYLIILCLKVFRTFLEPSGFKRILKTIIIIYSFSSIKLPNIISRLSIF